MTKEREVELKLEIDPSFARAFRAHPLFAAAVGLRARQISVYYDTPKAAIRKAGFTLRVRCAGRKYLQTVKRASGGGGLFDRGEWETQIRSAQPDTGALAETPLGRLLTGHLQRQLRPVVRSEVDRTTWLLENGKSRLEVVLDEGTIRAGDSASALCEVEIELKHGKASSAIDLARRLGETLPLRIGVLTKAERGFALAAGALDKATKAEPVKLDAEMDVAQGFAAIARACIRQFRLNEPLMVLRRDSAALHQARVALRRLRSAHSLFGRVIVDDSFPALREELRQLAGQLGEARNLDVFLAGPGQTAQHVAHREAFVAARERAYDEVIEALESPRVRTLVLDLVAHIEVGSWRRAGKAKKPLAELVRRRLDSRWEKVLAAGNRLHLLDEEQRHRLRIDIKKMRYALEFTSSLHGGPGAEGTKFIEALADMQESLGHLNDMSTAHALLLTIGEETHLPPSDPAAQKRHLTKASKRFRRLGEIGAYWRKY